LINKESSIMCGYCTEKMAFLALQAGHPDLPTEAAPLMLDVYLQEVRNLPDALQKLTTKSVGNPHIALHILCRAIEILVVHGFESQPYQELLQHPQFVTAILTACAESKQKSLDDVDQRLNPSGFSWLAEKDIYLMPGSFEQHNATTGDQTCTDLLSEYIDWWLVGGSVAHQDLIQRMKDTGIRDPIRYNTETELHLLTSRFPALRFALLRTSSLPVGTKTLWTIITRNPLRIPDFDGLDLWLQRQAALAYYDQQGLAPFLMDIEGKSFSVRIELLEFLAAARVFKTKDKDTLIAALDGSESDSGPADKWIWAANPQSLT